MSGVEMEYSNKWRILSDKTLRMFGNICGKNITSINPNDYYNFVDDPPRYDSQEEIRRFDIHKVDCSDVILADLRRPSIGTAMEIQHAFDKGIPIIGWYAEDEYNFTHPWIECCCMKRINGLNKACEYIANYLT